MARIILNTIIDAPIETCFDLSLSVEFHTKSMENSREKAVAGVTSGLIGDGQSVTWRAVHFLIPFKMTILVTSLIRPFSYATRMTRGPFTDLVNYHSFKSVDGKTVMTDDFIYSVPFGPLGRLVDTLVVKKHMTRLLNVRNDQLKKYAESGEAARFIPANKKV